MAEEVNYEGKVPKLEETMTMINTRKTNPAVNINFPKTYLQLPRQAQKINTAYYSRNNK